jgi:hypothetical protein
VQEKATALLKERLAQALEQKAVDLKFYKTELSGASSKI